MTMSHVEEISMEKKSIQDTIKDKIDNLSIQICSNPTFFTALEFAAIGAMLFLLDIAL